MMRCTQPKEVYGDKKTQKAILANMLFNAYLRMVKKVFKKVKILVDFCQTQC